MSILSHIYIHTHECMHACLLLALLIAPAAAAAATARGKEGEVAMATTRAGAETNPPVQQPTHRAEPPGRHPTHRAEQPGQQPTHRASRDPVCVSEAATPTPTDGFLPHRRTH
eukprot:GHVU01107741.1.p4 GENE.GHVU01107741.1~~GHVU01107741.1.p4  ORF type:complete len:113 (-),score=14.96 GHVU01107741.1:1285-1623(-)